MRGPGLANVSKIPAQCPQVSGRFCRLPAGAEALDRRQPLHVGLERNRSNRGEIDQFFGTLQQDASNPAEYRVPVEGGGALRVAGPIKIWSGLRRAGFEVSCVAIWLFARINHPTCPGLTCGRGNFMGSRSVSDCGPARDPASRPSVRAIPSTPAYKAT
jgi:hypothetical protein